MVFQVLYLYDVYLIDYVRDEWDPQIGYDLYESWVREMKQNVREKKVTHYLVGMYVLHLQPCLMFHLGALLGLLLLCLLYVIGKKLRILSRCAASCQKFNFYQKLPTREELY